MMSRIKSSVLLLLISATSTSSYLSDANDVAVAHLRSGFKMESANAINLMSQFHSWVELHDKVYENKDEMMKRMHIWMGNHELIEEHNNQLPARSFTLGHNEFSDMSKKEFHMHFGLGNFATLPKNAKNVAEPNDEVAKEIQLMLTETRNLDLPDYVNWITAGAVTPVKNQGSCGSCWAFSTTGALEGAKFINDGGLVPLSEQNLLDCDHEDMGCNGGLMDNAFKFDEKSGGLCSEEDYPYEAAQGDECKTECTDVPGSQVKTFVDVPPGKSDALLAALAMQPVSIAIQADQMVFQFYKSGVLDDDSCGAAGNIDHGVLAVGYGTDLSTQTPYWIVKNSWGETWGDSGYLKIARNSTNEFGQCAILKMASLPIVE